MMKLDVGLVIKVPPYRKGQKEQYKKIVCVDWDKKIAWIRRTKNGSLEGYYFSQIQGLNSWLEID